MIPAVAAAKASRIGGIAAYAFVPNAGQQEVLVRLRMATEASLAERDLLCAVVAVASDGDVLDPSDCSWHHSKQLDVAYEYLPAMSPGASVVELPTLRTSRPCSLLLFVVRFWGRADSAGSPEDVVVQECLCSQPVPIGTADVPVLRFGERIELGSLPESEAQVDRDARSDSSSSSSSS